MAEYFISISIGELQQWLADDQLTILSHRIVFSRKPLDDNSSADVLECLFNHLPAFALDDPAGILFVEIGGPATWGLVDYPDIYHVKLSHAKRFIPLTEDAKKALSVRWTNVINLSPAVFQFKFLYFRLVKKSSLACSAGNRFVSIFIESNSDCIDFNSLFGKSLIRAIMSAELSTLEEIECLVERSGEILRETWIERVFGDVRKHDIDNKLLHINSAFIHLRSIVILGVLFSKVDSTKVLTENIRAVYTKLKEQVKNKNHSLALVYADPELVKLRVDLFVDSQGGESISLVSLGLFLRWKQAFFDARSKVNTQLIHDDVISLVGRVEVDLVKNALWLMGAYLGMDYISATYRQLRKNEYPALQFLGNDEFPAPVIPWQVIENAPAPQILVSLAPVSDTVACTSERKPHIDAEQYETGTNVDSDQSGELKNSSLDGVDAKNQVTDNLESKQDQNFHSPVQPNDAKIIKIDTLPIDGPDPVGTAYKADKTNDSFPGDFSPVESCPPQSDDPASPVSVDAIQNGKVSSAPQGRLHSTADIKNIDLENKVEHPTNKERPKKHPARVNKSGDRNVENTISTAQDKNEKGSNGEDPQPELFSPSKDINVAVDIANQKPVPVPADDNK